MSAANTSAVIGQSVIQEPVNIIHGTKAQLVGFLVLNMWPSHLGLPILLALVLSKRIRRHATFANLCAAFIVIGLSSSLLVYDGRTTGPEPGRTICLLQASLLYGMPALASTAALSLVLQMYFMISAAHDGLEYRDADHIFRLWVMLVGPYIMFFISMLATAIIGAADPLHVSRSRRFFYCSVAAIRLTNTLTSFSAVVLMTTFLVMARTVWLLYRHMRMPIRYSQDDALRPQQRVRWNVDLNFPIRILAFGFYIIIAFSLSLLSMSSPSSPAPDLVIASAATVLILIFGTQKDIIQALRFWRKAPVLPGALIQQQKMGQEVDVDSRNLWSDKPLPLLPADEEGGNV